MTQPALLDRVRERMPVLRNDALTDHHLHPATQVEQFVQAREYAARLTEKLDPMMQRFRDLHGAELVPEGFADAAIRMVMEDDEVAEPLHFERRARIVALARELADFPSGQQLQQPVHRRLNEVDAGRFQRLDEP